METAIRQGKVPFHAIDIFPYGLSRSSYFNKRESEELTKYGHTFFQLQNGLIAPENEEEQMFVDELNSEEESTLYSVKLWKKFLHAVNKRRTFHGFSMSSRFIQDYTPNAANDDDDTVLEDDIEFAS